MSWPASIYLILNSPANAIEQMEAIYVKSIRCKSSSLPKESLESNSSLAYLLTRLPVRSMGQSRAIHAADLCTNARSVQAERVQGDGTEIGAEEANVSVYFTNVKESLEEDVGVEVSLLHSSPCRAGWRVLILAEHLLDLGSNEALLSEIVIQLVEIVAVGCEIGGVVADADSFPGVHV